MILNTNKEKKIGMKEIELTKDEKLVFNSDNFPLEIGKKYSISTKIKGFKGSPYSGYFGIIFLDNKNKEIGRKIR